MKDVVIIAILAVVVGFAVWYLYRSKKNGRKCIGCPAGGTCGKSGGSCCCDQKSE